MLPKNVKRTAKLKAIYNDRAATIGSVKHILNGLKRVMKSTLRSRVVAGGLASRLAIASCLSFRLARITLRYVSSRKMMGMYVVAKTMARVY